MARAGARKEEIAAAKATQAALEAEAALAQRNLDEAVLRAPAGGTILSRILEPGDLASPQRSVYTLALTEPLWARVYLSETALRLVRPGPWPSRPRVGGGLRWVAQLSVSAHDYVRRPDSTAA